MRRKREGVGGEREPAVQQSHGGTGQRGMCLVRGVYVALCPAQPELALQPASLGGGQKCMSPTTGTCDTQPNRAVDAERSVSRILSQGNHTVLPPRNIFCEISKCP